MSADIFEVFIINMVNGWTIEARIESSALQSDSRLMWLLQCRVGRQLFFVRHGQCGQMWANAIETTSSVATDQSQNS